MLIRVKYNGVRFPRTVSLQGNKRTSFQSDRKVLELEEYDALMLLKFNNRISPTVWEFTVEGVEPSESEKVIPASVQNDNVKEEQPDPAPQVEKPLKDNPKAKNKSKSGKK